MSNMFIHNQSIVYQQLNNEQALYTKYSSKKSKNFEDFFAKTPAKWVIDFKDHLHLQDDDEYLKRFYPRGQQPQKLQSLLDYYRYHYNLPRIFFGVLAEIAISFFEKKKRFEYRRIKKMLGIPYEESSQKYEKLNQDIQVLNSITKFTEQSTKSILNEFFKIQNNDVQINIDETWLTMQQYELRVPQINKNYAPQNLKLLKKLVQNHSREKIKLNLPFHLLKGKTVSNIRNSQNQSPERINPTQKSSSQQHINNSQEECEFKSIMKQKILTLSQQNKVKIQNIFKNKNEIDQNYYINAQGKRSNTHFITSTRSISSEQLNTEQIRLGQINLNGQDRQSQDKLINYVKHIPIHPSSQFTFQNEGSPSKKNQQLIQVYSNNISNKVKTQPKKSPQKQRVFHHTNSQSTKSDITKVLLQNFEKIYPCQQQKIKLDDHYNNNKRKQYQNNSELYRLQTENKQLIATVKNRVKSIIKKK
ncbi:unnamed protein product (macronuclear) [Paramecium tetraurelia]|uniref:PiggyBac transposable element-derived protein domain-containing protein n=1 Tax=Paramecium tetraurelia TaxID=5888 RepID=A0DSF4_PARTE|nr:uncharacterized protein GSPATT00019675001 [Paramecium tetraurelia]CAK85971.1 unnamed protein product [Paramecium tetraurelia]|eukprot:XP_001453368.1 hypothetical protein (macronuclear) [Paramecium tetraurelia strain d4-2]